MTTLELVREPALTGAIEQYLAHKRKKLTAKSERGYRAVLVTLAAFYPQIELADLDPPRGTILIEDFLNARYGHLAPRTYNKSFSTLHDFVTWHVARETLRRDPMMLLEKATPRAIDRQTFSDEECARIYAANAEPHDQIALHLLLDYALRKGAIQNVKLEHFDWQTRRLKVYTKGEKIMRSAIVDERIWHLLGSLDEPGHHYLMPHQVLRRRRPPHKKHFALAESLLQELRATVAQIDDAQCARELAELGRSVDRAATWHELAIDAASVQVRRFPAERAGEHQLHDWWYRCLARADVVPKGTSSGRRMHGARHTAIQRVLEKTGNLKAAQKVAGHAHSSTTSDVYTDWSDEQVADSMRVTLGLDHVLQARAADVSRGGGVDA